MSAVADLLARHPQFRKSSAKDDADVAECARTCARAYRALLAAHSTLAAREEQIRERYARNGAPVPEGEFDCAFCRQPVRSHATDAFRRGDDPLEPGWGLCPTLTRRKGDAGRGEDKYAVYLRPPGPGELERREAQVERREVEQDRREKRQRGTRQRDLIGG